MFFFAYGMEKFFSILQDFKVIISYFSPLQSLSTIFQFYRVLF